MNIYFLESNKIYTFKLPLEIAGSYILSDYDEYGNKRSLVSVEASSGKWVIKDNDEVKIFYNSAYNKEAILEYYNFYQLVVYGTETILMYIAPVYDSSYICTRILDNTTLTCGNSGCDINFPIISPKQLELSFVNGKFSFKNLNQNIPVYINNARKEFGYLSNFDTIFIMGLKILILGKNIYINNPNSSVNIFSDKFGDPQFNVVYQDYKANSEFYKDFYDEKDYFYKTPVFQNAFEKLDLTVAPPPQKSINRGNPLFLQMVPSALMSVTSLYSGFQAFSSISSGKGTVEDNMLSIITCVVMLFTSIAWPFIERFYEKISNIATELKRNRVYNKYLKEKEELFNNISNKQKAILIERYLSLPECRDAIYNKSSNLFSRGYDNENFLSVRLGLGDVPLYADIHYDRAEYSEINDKLIDKAANLVKKYKYLKDTPCYLSLYDKNICAFIGNISYKKYYINAILLQLIAFQSYGDLRIVILTDNAASSSFHYLKTSNYCFSPDKSFRFYATTFDEGQMLSEYLEKIFINRQKNTEENKSDENNDKKNFPYYLIISDNISMYKNLKIVKDVLEEKSKLGFGILMFDERVNNIPDGCENFVNYDEKEGYYFTSEMNTDSIQKFKPEFAGGSYSDINIEECISKVSNIPLKIEIDDSGSLPDSLGFLEMYGVGRVEQLNIVNRWQTSNIVNSLMTPIGVDVNGNLLNLDLHEKKHGPHGLIAGMTGSGKSECIVTYLLSLAVNYSPDEVQFVLIDYKGGGLAGAFENRKTGVKLPHLVGTITNLDQSEMKRTLVSIKSELQRRQRIFNEAKEQLNTGNIDIYKYQRLVRDGKLTAPLSHLFIVCDEFAELKAQQPDFMDELVSAARIGRSLGVHLILATQKPSGVVDDQIWSNSKFKLCCKVQTAEDSNEMIRKPDAAFIKEAGRFYLQVGYDEYFVKGQSAYTGVGYIPSDKIKSKISTSIGFINNLGEIIKSVSKDGVKNDKKESLGEELINISQYIIELANKNNFKYKQLWLDNVPKILYLDELNKKYNIEIKPFNINPLIGEYDDPKNQRQGPVVLPITEGGNVYIAGANGMGKTTLMSSILYSISVTHKPEEVNFYIIDLGAEKLRKFSRFPHVGEVLGVNDTNKITYLLYMLNDELNKRKEYFANIGSDFLTSSKTGKNRFPNIITFIYGADIFRENFSEDYEEIFVPLVRNCNKYGIYFVISGLEPSSLGYACDNSFPIKLMLNLSDSTQYSDYFVNFPIPSKNPGRGLIEINENCLEFQSVIITNDDDEPQRLNHVTKKLNEIFKCKIKAVPELPKKLEFSYLKNSITDISNVPLGLNLLTAQIGFNNFDKKITTISGDNILTISKFISSLVKSLSFCNNNNVIILNGNSNFKIKVPDNVKYYDSNFSQIIPVLMKNIIKYNDISSEKKFSIVILNYSKINMHLQELSEDNEEIALLDDLIKTVNNEYFKFTIYDSVNNLKKLSESSLSEYLDNESGIWVGKDMDMQDYYSYDNPSYVYKLNLGNDTVTIIKDLTPEYLKFSIN
ncbi:MAG: type VII secretion protein EssC [Bacilli bacterium]|nr:type VII secretion protein EssC [Bacilli bacterium]